MHLRFERKMSNPVRPQKKLVIVSNDHQLEKFSKEDFSFLHSLFFNECLLSYFDFPRATEIFTLTKLFFQKIFMGTQLNPFSFVCLNSLDNSALVSKSFLDLSDETS